MYNHILTATGMSQSGMEIFVFGLIAVLVLGFILVMYWPFIVAGALVVFCVSVMANHQEPSRPVERLAPAGIPAEDVIAKPVEKEYKSEPFDEAKAFLQDCLAMTDYTKKQCQKLWDGREDDVATNEQVKFKLLNVDNKEYKARRDKTLQMPNAVVGHFTYH